MKIFLAVLGVLFSSLCMAAPSWKPDRVEPPFWWVDMANSQVQVLIYGKDIGLWTPEIDDKRVALAAVERVSNPNYLFITLDVQQDAAAGELKIRLSRQGMENRYWTYSLLPRSDSLRRHITPADAIYLVVPDRFANGNPANDQQPDMLEKPDRGHASGRHGGDLAGLTQHLPYINGMGFTALWLTPVLENNQPAYSYHGYATTDHYRIDPRLGTREEYRGLSQAAAEQGIALVKDIIVNHVGSEHWWRKDPPDEQWFNVIAPGDYRGTTHYRTTLQDPYAATIDRQAFTDGWFSPHMPDLNQRHPLLARYLIQNSLWWIEYAGLSGIRADTWSYADKEFLARWIDEVLYQYPDLFFVGEEWSSNPAIVAYWQKNALRSDRYDSPLPSLMDFPTYEQLRAALAQDEAWGQGWIQLYENLVNDRLYGDPSQLVIFGENHDTSRLYSHLDEQKSRFRMAMVYLATMRGIPQFFYGSEVLLTSPKTRDDGAVRADFPGGWPDDKRNAFTGKGLTKDQQEMQQFLRELLQWRKQAEVVHSGKLMHFAPQDGVYVWFRYQQGAAVMVAANKSAQQQPLDWSRYRERLEGFSQARHALTQQHVNIDQPYQLAPGAVVILELSR